MFIPDDRMIFGGFLYDEVKGTETIYRSNGRGYLGCLFRFIDNSNIDSNEHVSNKNILVVNIHQGHGRANNFELCIKKIESDFKKNFNSFNINDINRIIIGGDFNNKELLDGNYTLFGKQLNNVDKNMVNYTCCINKKKENNKFDKKIDYVFDSFQLFPNARVDYDINNQTFTNTSDHKPVIYNLKNNVTKLASIPNYIFNQNGLQEI